MPVSPYFALPSLLGQLKAEGYNAKALDLNINFYNDILKKENILEAIERASALAPALLEEIKEHHTPDKKAEDYPFEIQNKIARYGKIKDFLTKRTYELEHAPVFIEEAKKTLGGEDFYKPEAFTKSLFIIESALEILSLPYAPAKITFASYENPFLKLNFENIKYWVFDKSANMFWDYFEKLVEELPKAEYIGISINSSSQIIAGLTLAHLLKKQGKAHINIGGNYFGRVIENLSANLEFFELFCDSILVEEGEKPVVDLAKYLEGKISIEEVSNLVYIKDGEVKINPKAVPRKLDELAPVSLEGYNLKSYFTPEIIMPHQTSKGCYWGKCSFCDQDFGQHFNIKNVDKFLDELADLGEKYGIKSFEFIDESVSPAYMEELASKILERGLDINYFSNARLEGTFTKEILELARKSGLRMLLWGLESGSDKIMELINKGIDLEKRFKILRNSAEADIWNFAFIFFGFPAETREDALKTIEMLCSNNDIIDSYGRSVFTMGKHTKLRSNPECYGIVGVSEAQDELSPSYDFKAIGMDKKGLGEIIKLCTQTCAKAYNNPLWMYLRYREFLFLYIKKYGRNWVRDYNIRI